MKRLIRSATYRLDLDDIEHYISKSNRLAANRLVEHIDDQFACLTDPNFPRRVGRVKGTFELVVGKRYLVIFIEDAIEITALNVLHVKRRYP
jgi:toxin ParE1/3/4